MAKEKISDLFQIRSRFLRSANLERDFEDPACLSGYVMTDFTRSCLAHVANGLKPCSGQRAWRITGDYGNGKSSFALLLAHWFAGRTRAFPQEIRKVVGGVTQPRFVPVLVTCSRQALGTSILNSLYQTLTQIYRGRAKINLVREVQRLLETNQEPTEDQIFKLVLKVHSRIIEDSKGKGLLLILDELGKFLEFAALHPQRQDVFLLQRLAEAASRSGDQPLFVVSLLHQGFNAYSDMLSQSAQREWEKIAGRFEEIVFSQPIDQVAQRRCFSSKRSHKGDTENGISGVETSHEPNHGTGLVWLWLNQIVVERLASALPTSSDGTTDPHPNVPTVWAERTVALQFPVIE